MRGIARRIHRAHELACPIPLLPEYFGYGAVTRGALDAAFSIYHVTHLGDTGAGSFRDAVSASNRYIVFDVGGTIRLLSTIDMTGRAFLTIDGLTAPWPGITIDKAAGSPHNSINIENSNDIVTRGLRCRWHSEGIHVGSGDIFATSNSSRLIFDRMSCIASSDGIFDIFGTGADMSVTRSLLAHTFDCSNMNTGPPGGPDPSDRDRITYAYNVYTHNNDRQPCRVTWRSYDIDVIGNIVYGWGWTSAISGAFLLVGDNGTDPARVNFEENTMKHVTGLSAGPGQAIVASGAGDPVRTFLLNNDLPPEETYVGTEAERWAVPARFQVPRGITKKEVLMSVGPRYRGPQDQRLIQEVAAGLGIQL